MTERETSAGGKRRALLVANPGARRANEAIDHILDDLWDGGIEIVGTPIEDANDPETGLGVRKGEADIVIVAGGDGSICRAAPAVIASGLPLGILPLGTANDLARTLGIPTDLAAAAEVIAAGHSRRIDCGSVNGHPFFNVASIGLSVELARELSPELKQRWGRIGYAVAALRTLAKARRFSATIREEDATVRTRTMQIAVGNGRFYGGGTVVASHAEIDDGHLDLYSLEMHTVWRLALMLKSFRTGSLGAWSEVRTLRGTEFEVHTRVPKPVNADGELIAETPAVFKVHPAVVEVLCPPRPEF